MAARKITVTNERKGLSHVSVFTWDARTGEMASLYAGSIEDGRFRGLCSGVDLTDEEREIAMKAAQ